MRTTRRQFGILAGLAAPVALASAASPRQGDSKDAPPALAATLILVRHTEKAKDDRVDPSLSEAGQARAEEFARMFSAAGVTSLLHSEYKRTRNTLAPLAKALEIESETIGASEMPKMLERLRTAKAGEVIAIAGHSNTIPAIAYAFGVTLPDLAPIDKGSKLAYGYLPHEAYNRVHVLTPGTEGKATLVELRYGE